MPPGSATALADALATLLADPELAARLSEAGRIEVRVAAASGWPDRARALPKSLLHVSAALGVRYRDGVVVAVRGGVPVSGPEAAATR